MGRSGWELTPRRVAGAGGGGGSGGGVAPAVAVCRHYAEHGHCLAGGRCVLSHDMQVNSSALNSSALNKAGGWGAAGPKRLASRAALTPQESGADRCVRCIAAGG